MSRTVVTIHGPQGKILVGNLANARRAVEVLWPGEKKEGVIYVQRMLDAATEGTCTPRAALTAFLAAAKQDYVVSLPPNTQGTREIDALLGR